MKKIWVSIAFCITVISVAGAAALFSKAPEGPPRDFKVSFVPKPWEVNVERGYLLLDKGWKFFKGAPQKITSVDDVATGIVNPKNYVLRDGTNVPIGMECEKPEAPDCDDSSWITVDVPFNWYDLGPEMDEFKGTTWYRKTFEVSADRLKGRAVVHFRGAYYRAWVWLNGERVGAHEGGYTPFEFEITKLLKPGKNALAVRVSNVIGPDDIQIGDWWNYGGIHREVFVEFTGAARVASLSIEPELNADLSAAAVKFKLDVDGAGADAAKVYIYRLNGENKELVDSVAVPVSGAGAAGAEWSAVRPALWSPEEPNLYFAKAVLFSNGKPVDGYGDVFGFRKFEVRGTAVYLNGKRTFFRGVNRHDEHFHGEPPDAGRVMTEEERIGDFKAIKDMNGNAMRTAHYPNHPYNYYITDRLGIMTIEEGGPIGGPLNDDAHIGKLKHQLKEMVDRDRNHPSIILWSIGNEFGGDRFIKYIGAAAEYMRSIDGRLLTFTETGGRDVQKGYSYVDVLSRNEYEGWYGTVPADPDPRVQREFVRSGVAALLTRYHTEYPDKPVFIMETGAESVCGRHAANPDKKVARGDEEYQENVLKFQFEELLKHDYVAGVFPWILADFKTQKPGGTCQFTPHLNRKGLLCPDRTKKLAYFLISDIYKKLAGK
jgi:beta-glucuronidase